MYQCGYLKNVTYPEIKQIWQAITAAESPNSKDVRNLKSILMRMPLASPRIAGHISTRKTAISSFDWDIISDVETELDPVKERLKKLIDYVLSAFIEVPIFDSFLIELEWTNIEGSWVPLIHKHYAPVELEKDFSNVIIVDDTNKKTPILPEDKQKYIYSTDGGPNIGGVLRSILFHEVLRHETLSEWADFNKKLKGLIQAQAPQEEKADAAAALESFVSDQFAVTSDNVKFILNELTSSKAAESYTTFKEILEKDISIAILGQANTADLPNNGGSRAALQVQNLIRADVHFSDMQKVREIINNQVLLYDYQINVDKTATAAPYEFEFCYDDVKDVEANARAISQILNAGIPLLKNEVYAKIDYTPPAVDVSPNDLFIPAKQKGMF